MEGGAGLNRRVVLGRVLSHDNSAALLVDGEIVAAIAAERLSGHKHDHDNNDLAIRYCLRAASLKMEDVDVVVQNSPKHYFRSGPESDLIAEDDPRVFTLSHHLAHAWAAWATCPFEDAAIVVVDGRGSFVPSGHDVVLSPGNSGLPDDGAVGWQLEVESIYRADCSGLQLLQKNANRGMPASIGASFSRQDGLYPGEYSGYYQYAGIGALYEQAARGLFRAALDGGKVMGLSSYAEPNPERARQMLTPGAHGVPMLGVRWLFDIGGPVSVSARFCEAAQIAADVQLALEEGVEAIARRARELTGSANLCLTGGVALNCRANERLHRAGIFDRIFIQPACNDAGTSLGCAFYGDAVVLGAEVQKRRYSDYLGVDYGDAVLPALRDWEGAVVRERTEQNVVQATAELLAPGRIVGFYRGRSEFGPRALGHRSIFALPDDGATRDRLNACIKRREAFRPFAPIVTAEAAPEIFEIDGESPYMLRTVLVRAPFRSALQAVTHVDGTARIQTVTREDEPVLHALLEKIGGLHGLPVLLNTSFNTAGFPIVETPGDALLCLLSSGLDAVVFEGWVARRRFVDFASLTELPPLSARLRLLPNVVMESSYVHGTRHAVLVQGPRRLKLTASQSELLMSLAACVDVAAQLRLAAHFDLPSDFLSRLLADGWMIAETVSDGGGLNA